MHRINDLEPNIEVEKMLLLRKNTKAFLVASHKISDTALLDQKKPLLDLNVVKTHLLNEGKLTTKQLEKILRDGSKVLKKEPNLIEIDKKCYIFGDIHGQFYDLVAALDKFDFEKDTVLFLGDYVDRGVFGVETYLYLIMLKSHYPNNVFLLRGNHESGRMTKYFTFKEECVYKYGEEAYQSFINSFNCLPIAAVVQNRAFCAHAGISPALIKLNVINLADRFREVEYTGLFCDLMWSDPHENYNLGLGRSFEHNLKRRCSYTYNYEDVIQFLERNDLQMIIRAHEVQEQGYDLMKMYKTCHSVVTVFSAPCYCDTYQNKGAYIAYDNGITSIHQFEAVPHPFVISGFIDGINWSMPFIAEKIVELAVIIFEELDKCDVLEEPESFVNNMNLMRLEREAIDEFEKEESVDSCILSTVEDEFNSFNEVKEKDKLNEIAKDTGTESTISIDISPSLVSDSIANSNINSTDINVVDTNITKHNKDQNSKGFCRYFCGM